MLYKKITVTYFGLTEARTVMDDMLNHYFLLGCAKKMQKI